VSRPTDERGRWVSLAVAGDLARPSIWHWWAPDGRTPVCEAGGKIVARARWVPPDLWCVLCRALLVSP